jgi:hypothetical protein
MNCAAHNTLSHSTRTVSSTGWFCVLFQLYFYQLLYIQMNARTSPKSWTCHCVLHGAALQGSISFLWWEFREVSKTIYCTVMLVCHPVTQIHCTYWSVVLKFILQLCQCDITHRHTHSTYHLVLLAGCLRKMYTPCSTLYINRKVMRCYWVYWNANWVVFFTSSHHGGRLYFTTLLCKIWILCEQQKITLWIYVAFCGGENRFYAACLINAVSILVF